MVSQRKQKLIDEWAKQLIEEGYSPEAALLRAQEAFCAKREIVHTAKDESDKYVNYKMPKTWRKKTLEEIENSRRD